MKENDHVTQIDSRTCCRRFSQRHGAGSLRRFREAVVAVVDGAGGWGFHHHHFGGFGIGYIGGYDDDGCYVTRRVLTPFGYRLRTFNVCGY